MKNSQSNYQEKRVDESILELKLKEAGKLVSKVDDKLYDLEKYAIHMDAVSSLCENNYMYMLPFQIWIICENE